MKIGSAATPIDTRGQQFHIKMSTGELAENILLVGDPARVHTIAQLFDEIDYENENREFAGISGKYQGMHVSVLSTGIGPSGTEIAILEAMQITQQPTFIRIGSCAGIPVHVQTNDYVISTAAVRLEAVSTLYVYPGYPAVAHHEVVTALDRQCKTVKRKSHLGFTASTSSFYAGQARNFSRAPALNHDLLADLTAMQVLNFEMEASTLFTLASLHHCKAGCLCMVFANREADTFIELDAIPAFELEAGEIGLNALLALAQA